jgi:hypothetical protein
MKKQKNIVVRILQILIGIEIVWLILGNLFLSTNLGAWAVNIKPEKFTMSWESAWTPYPARIYVKDLTLNIHTRTTDIQLKSDIANANIRFLPLLKKHLVIDQVRAGNVITKLTKTTPPEDYPVSTKTSAGFTFELRDMQIEEINELSLNQLKIIGGKSHASGTIKIQIRGEVELTDIDADWKNAKIQLDDNHLAESLSIKLIGGVEPFLPKKDKGVALMKKISAIIDVDGTVGSLKPLIYFFQDYDWIERIDGKGVVEAHLELVQGELKLGSKFNVSADGLELDFLGFNAQGSGQVNGEVIDSNNNLSSVLKLVFDNFALSRQGELNPLAVGEGLSLIAKSHNMGLVESLNNRNLELILDIPSSEVPDISFLASSLPDALGISLFEGGASLRGNMKVSGIEKTAEGNFELQGENLKGKFRDMNFEMDMELSSKVSGKQLDDFKVELNGTEFKLLNGIFDNDTVEVDKKWWMTVSIPEGQATLAQPFNLAADIDMSMKDTRAIIAMFAEMKDWIRHFDGILTVNDVTGSAEILAGNQRASIRNLQLDGDRLEVMAELELGEESNAGILWGKLGIISAGVETINEERDWKFINGRDWFEQRKVENWSDR